MPDITTQDILSALCKVEKVNHIKLDRISQIVVDNPQQAVSTFSTLIGFESMDDRFKYIVNDHPHLESDIHHLLETSVLLG